MATSYSIVRNHQGTIDVSSEVGKGSTFCIFLPAAEAAAEPQAASPGPAAGRKGRVLIMDDEEMVRAVASRMIQALGHEVECAVHGEEAIEKVAQARAAGRPYDVAILDLTVRGGMGGESAVKRLLEIDRELKAIVSSGYGDSPILADYRSYGFMAILGKPYRIDSLGDLLNSLLAE